MFPQHSNHQSSTFLDRLLQVCEPSTVNSFLLARGFQYNDGPRECMDVFVAKHGEKGLHDLIRMHPDYEVFEEHFQATNPVPVAMPAPVVEQPKEKTPAAYEDPFKANMPMIQLLMVMTFVYLIIKTVNS